MGVMEFKDEILICNWRDYFDMPLTYEEETSRILG